MKRDCSLFSRLYIACQTRDGNLDDFFKHENQGCPPSLSDQGHLRLPTKKSELTEYLQELSTPQSKKPENIDVIILDGAALVNMIKPGQDKTFSQYAETIKKYIASQLSQTNRLDIV